MTLRDTSDTAIAELLALARWGPTGFCCPHCDHDRAWLVSKRRPRDRECRKCHRTTSVTSGTLLHRTRLPLIAWVRRGEQLATSTRIPTTSELASEYGIARSSAWLLTQKMLRCAQLALDAPVPAGCPARLLEITVRRPKRTPPLTEAAPPHVRALHERHRERRIHSAAVTVAFDLDGPVARLARVGLPPDEARTHARQWSSDEHTRTHYGLRRWLWAEFVFRRGPVSLRWLPRWLQGVLLAWALAIGDVALPCWTDLAIRCGPRPLRSLDPWKAVA